MIIPQPRTQEKTLDKYKLTVKNKKQRERKRKKEERRRKKKKKYYKTHKETKTIREIQPITKRRMGSDRKIIKT